MKMKKIFLFLVLGALLSGRVWAGISVTPSAVEKVLPPGTMAQGSYQVSNTGDSPIHVLVEAEDWMARLYGKPVDIPVERWLRLEPTEFDLAAGETREVRYRVLAPPELRGEKVAQVYFSYEVAKGLRSKLGVIFFLTARGTERLGLGIEQGSFAVAPENEGNHHLTVDLNLQNSGNVHLRPQGALVILDGKEKKDEVLIREIPGIFPETIYHFTRSYPLNRLEKGHYTVRLRLDYGYTFDRINQFVQQDFPLEWKEGKPSVPEK